MTNSSAVKSSDPAQLVAKPVTQLEPATQQRDMASPARMKKRHWLVVLSFIVFVLAPLGLISYYLYERSADQYASRTGFSVRSEDVSAALDVLGGLGGLDTSTNLDSDILYEYIQSSELIRKVDAELDLDAIYSAHYDTDPVFGFKQGGTIEDLTQYWQRMVKVFYDSGNGLIELRVHAFTAQDAQNIAVSIFENSSAKINELSAIAREDSTLYAREELGKSVERLKVARQALTEFRSQNRLVDPTAEIGAQTGLMTALEQQLSDALINYDLLRETSGQSDPRVNQAELRISVIRQRIEEEREKFGASDVEGADYSRLIGEYERLLVDKEFAEQAYLAALTAFDNAQTEAQRKSRYLAAYVAPTLAERAEYPQRITLLALAGFFLLFSWTVVVLVAYSIKDRR